MKVLICHSHGFTFSSALCLRLGLTRREVDALPRTDARLIAAVEEMGAAATKPGLAGEPELAIVEVPDGVRYTIVDYDGREAMVLGLPEQLTVMAPSGARRVQIGEFFDASQLVEMG